VDKNNRLGANGFDEIFNHPFFKPIKWDRIMEEEAPFKPLGRDIDT
jgi:hypothetical protein